LPSSVGELDVEELTWCNVDKNATEVTYPGGRRNHCGITFDTGNFDGSVELTCRETLKSRRRHQTQSD
jgi:hypothetical protein